MSEGFLKEIKYLVPIMVAFDPGMVVVQPIHKVA